jgi:phosphoserine phosphatase
MTSDPTLPSWRPGPTRDAVVRFLNDAESLPLEARVACFDNDGTLWCERPSYVQLDFFVDALRSRSRQDPRLDDRPEYAALLSGDPAAIHTIGLPGIALALVELFEGMTPDRFTDEVRAFLSRGTNHRLGRPLSRCTYQPMLELITELRRRDFTVAIVTGGGTEFVRAISHDLYGVPPEAVVGTLIDYTYGRDDSGRPTLRRAGTPQGVANEGPAKVSNIQSQLGRRPVLAAGNSGGDRDMLEWATAGAGPGLALLVNHDDSDREFAYRGTAETFAEVEPITDVAARSGWTVISMANDWQTVFSED